MNPVRQLLKFAPFAVLSTDSPDFGAHAQTWWAHQGPMAPLHRLNPTRLAYLKQVICQSFQRNSSDSQPLKGLSCLDIGCGGGLVTEPLARLGATVTGLDASADLIAVAQDHAARQNLKIDYRAVLSSVLVAEKKTYDVVSALEVIEHVNDPAALLADIQSLLKPNGVAIVSTLNRTPQSFLKGIVAAEYLVRWVPRGTHDWHAFLKPHELVALAQQNGLQAVETMGLHYDALRREFSLRADRLEVNYFMVFHHGN